MPPNPPLAGRPPYATDEDDSVYLNPNNAPTRRRQQPKQEINAVREESQYGAYDEYFQEQQRNSGAGAVGMLMNGALDDDSDDDEDDRKPPVQPAQPRQLVPQPQGGRPSVDQNRYNEKPPVAPIQPLAPAARSEKSTMQQRSPVQYQQPAPAYVPQQHPQQPDMRQNNPNARGPPPALNVTIPGGVPVPRHPAPAFMQPPPSPGLLKPHPLDAPPTPITPVFARPSMDQKREVKFEKPILRGDSEETLLSRSTAKGDDFWRRFSMIAKDDMRKAPKDKKSTFLKTYEGGSSRLSKWVWIIAVIVLLCIGGAIGLGWYFTHNNPVSTPKVIGSAGGHETLGATAPGASKTPAASGTHATASSSRTLAPAPTLARRKRHGHNRAFDLD